MGQVAGQIIRSAQAMRRPLSPSLGLFLAALVGLAPALLIPLTWTTDADAASATWFLRSTSTTVLLAEMAIVAAALLRGIAWRRFADPGLLLPALALAAIAVGTALYAAPNPPASHLPNLQYLLHAAFFVALASLLADGLDGERLRLAYAAGFLIFAAAIALFILLTPWTPAFDWRHHLPAVSHIRQYGFYAAPVAALSLGGLAAARGRMRWFHAATVFAATFLAAYTGSRGAVYSIIIGGALALGIVPELRTRRFFLPAGLAVVAGVALALPLPAPSSDMGAGRSVPAIEAAGQSEDFTTGRTSLWRKTWTAIERRPWFGHGEGQLPWVVDFYRMPQPHNVILQLAFAWGFVGLALATWIAGRIAWRTLLRVREAPLAQSGTVFMVAILAVYGMVDGVFFRTIPLSMLAAALAMTFASRKVPAV